MGLPLRQQMCHDDVIEWKNFPRNWPFVLSKQWWAWWFETLSRPFWRHCNVWSAIHYCWSAFINMLCWKFLYLTQKINVIDIDIAMVTMHMTAPGIRRILLIACNSLWWADANIDHNKPNFTIYPDKALLHCCNDLNPQFKLLITVVVIRHE